MNTRLSIALSALILASCAASSGTHSIYPKCVGQMDETVPFVGADATITAPTPIRRVEPLTPRDLLGRRRTATLELLIGSDGTVQAVCQTSGDVQWGGVASDAVRHWLFAPARRAGEAIPIRFTITTTIE